MPRSIRLLALPLLIAGCLAAGACFLFSGGSDIESVPIPSGATAVAISPLEYGTAEICAVSGEIISLSSQSRSAAFRGRTYYLRDQQALDAFTANPEGYMLGN